MNLEESSDWVSATDGAYCYYNNEETWNSGYGKLYNWHATVDPRGLCPADFRVPNDLDWDTLVSALGTLSDVGDDLKSTPIDNPAWDGNNSSGFSAVAGGNRDNEQGYFDSFGHIGDYWSSSVLNEGARVYYLFGGHDMLNVSVYPRFSGYSVRCIKEVAASCYDPDNDGVCAENEVSGCTDSNATNFNPAATEDDGSCALPGPAQCGGASSVTFDGHTYALVGIGTQCWFKENLRSDNYLNGDEIPGDLSGAEWVSTTTGAHAAYDNNLANVATYGRLYNWFAVNDARGLCPSGWHVPSDSEWNILIDFLGGHPVGGNKMKAAPFDEIPWSGSNESGFSGLPGGARYFQMGPGPASYANRGSYGYWWSSTTVGTDGAAIRQLYHGPDVAIYGYNIRDGISVRCLKNNSPLVCNDPDNDGVCAENEVSGCTDSNAANFNPAATEDDGSCVLAGPAQCGGASTVTFDGHTYALVGIGTQCWFKENLRSDNYANGDSIPLILAGEPWGWPMPGAQTYYDLAPNSLDTHGRLYNWFAVNDARGLCPVGFHAPSDVEWMTLETALGMTALQADSIGWRGTDQGAQLKVTSNSSPPWNGLNDSEFSALPGGYRWVSNGEFSALGTEAWFWTSTGTGSSAFYRALSTGSSAIYRNNSEYNASGNGFSVRCVKD